MADELIRRAHEVAVVPRSSRSTQTIGFTAGVFHWSDLPARTQQEARHSTPVVAEQAVADGDVQQVGPELLQVLRAWRAHRDRVYVATAERTVVVGEHSLSGAGPWRHVDLSVHESDGTPQRRIGWVPAGVAGSPKDPSPAASGLGRDPAAPAAAPAHAAAARAWPFLPAAVRDGALRTVPVPVDWLGQLVQVAGSDRMPRSQKIVVLRRDERTALVIRATRELAPVPGSTVDEHVRALARADWLVEQVTYGLTPRPGLPSSRLGTLPDL
ncbi:hypothetical protein ACPPVS_16505 [Cellulomonas sp. McL0617]|uniref:hypothetical protein n=1 Tax=Cellulomonas sp. McL0617 TaxID=3415675 RepID=UPI003CE8BE1D